MEEIHQAKQINKQPRKIKQSLTEKYQNVKKKSTSFYNNAQC